MNRPIPKRYETVHSSTLIGLIGDQVLNFSFGIYESFSRFWPRSLTVEMKRHAFHTWIIKKYIEETRDVALPKILQNTEKNSISLRDAWGKSQTCLGRVHLN